MGFLCDDEIRKIGFASVGKNVQLSDKASFYGASRIKVGDNVRIDDFCLLSSGDRGIEIGSYVHIGAYSSLLGAGKITLSDFSGVSSRVSIYSSTDDYSGKFMTNPTLPAEYTGVYSADVNLCKHVIIGSGSVILPGVTIKMAAAVGALSLVNKDCDEFCIYSGVPIKLIKKRLINLLELEKEFVRKL